MSRKPLMTGVKRDTLALYKHSKSTLATCTFVSYPGPQKAREVTPVLRRPGKLPRSSEGQGSYPGPQKAREVTPVLRRPGVHKNCQVALTVLPEMALPILWKTTHLSLAHTISDCFDAEGGTSRSTTLCCVCAPSFVTRDRSCASISKKVSTAKVHA